MSSCLECFLSGGDLYLYQYSVSTAVFLAKVRGGACTMASCDPPEAVLYRARYLLETGFGVYDVTKNNCEDFAVYCKTGLLVISKSSEVCSGQASSFLAAAAALGPSSYLFLSTRFSRVAAIASNLSRVAGTSSIPGVAAVASTFPGLVGAATGVPGLAVVGCASYCLKRLASDIGGRSDALKVPVEHLHFLIGQKG